MRERVKERLRELDIRIVGWVDQWDPLAAQWLFESYPDIEPSELNSAIALDWFRSLKRDPRNTFYAITSKGGPIGLGAIMAQNPIMRSAECHLFLDGSMMDKGIGRLVAEDTFDTLFENGFESLSISPLRSNTRAINSAKRLGFQESERVVTMTLSRSDWMAKRAPVLEGQKTEGNLGEAHG